MGPEHDEQEAGGGRVALTACIVAMNEADRIGPCLESVAFCDEILVLDSGSTDGTQAICREAGARVIETDWPGFVAQKNRAAEAATHDWVLSLDADERVDEALRGAILALARDALGRSDGPKGYEIRRKVRYLGRWLKHGGWYPEWRLRLYDRRAARWGGHTLHEYVVCDGEVGRVREGDLEHHTYRSLEDQLTSINRYTTLAAEERVAKGARGWLLPALLRPPFHFVRHYLLYLGFLDGWPGFAMCVLRSYYVFLKYAKTWEATWERKRRT